MPNGLVYLRASPEKCMSRLKRRARSEETGVPLEYLQVGAAYFATFLVLPALSRCL